VYLGRNGRVGLPLASGKAASSFLLLRNGRSNAGQNQRRIGHDVAALQRPRRHLGRPWLRWIPEAVLVCSCALPCSVNGAAAASCTGVFKQSRNALGVSAMTEAAELVQSWPREVYSEPAGRRWLGRSIRRVRPRGRDEALRARQHFHDAAPARSRERGTAGTMTHRLEWMTRARAARPDAWWRNAVVRRIRQ
jgi:hypothetical protein